MLRASKRTESQSTYCAPTLSVSGRVVEKAEAEHQEDDGSPGDFSQQLQAANSSPLHGIESQNH